MVDYHCHARATEACLARDSPSPWVKVQGRGYETSLQEA
jgi:hypothetical protein